MRKWISMLLLALLAIGTGTAAAADPEDLVELAAYYPQDTAAFFAIRTDAAFFDTLDGLAQRLSELLPGAVPSGVSVQEALDQLSREFTGQDFDTAFRPWLGDTIAVGFELNQATLTSDTPPLLITAAVTDRGAAEAFIDRLLVQTNQADGYTSTLTEAYTRYEPPAPFNPTVVVTDDALFITTIPELLPPERTFEPLLADEQLAQGLAALPEDSYNAVALVNIPAIQQFSTEVIEMAGQSLSPALRRLNDSGGIQVLGFTVLDGDSLVIDAATVGVDADALAELGFDFYYPEPLDLDFSARVPADAAFVIQGTEFGAVAQSSLDSLRAFSDFVAENEGLASLLGVQDLMTPDEQRVLNALELDLGVSVLNATFAGFTGLSLERDVLPALDGDAALFLRVLPAEGFVPALPDFGLLFQVSEPQRAQALVDALTAAAELYGSGYPTEAYGETGSALLVPGLSEQLPGAMGALDLLFAAQGELFAFGTRPGVEQAITGTGGLAGTDAFLAAQAYFLPGAQQLLYANLAPLGDLIDELVSQGDLPRGAVRDLGDVRLLLSVVESASITSVAESAESALGRLVLTLSDEPASLPPLGSDA